METKNLSDIKSTNEIIREAIFNGTKITVRLPSGDFETAIISGAWLEFPVVHTQSGLQAQVCRATLHSILCGFSAFIRF